MVESFNVPKNAVSKWAGITSAAFSLSQAVTGILWGRASDRYGRKPTILCALLSAMCTSLLFGFSRSLAWAIVARSLAGASNGNVGILRTTVAEMVPYKELQPIAFSIMPLVWTIGSIFGPGFGGALANPAAKYPGLFGASFFKRYPFALPNIVASIFFMLSIIIGFLFLKETLETRKHNRDYGRIIGELIIHPFRRKKPKKRWQHEEEQSQSLLKHSRIPSVSAHGNGIDAQEDRKTIPLARPSYREVFSRQSNLNLLVYTLLAFHSLAYDQVLPIFMHYPQQSNRSSDSNVHLPFKFAGGFGINSGRIGLLFTIYGIVGMFVQFLVFPPVARRYGVLPCLKFVTAMFPFVYIITPFTALLPTAFSQQIGMFCIMLVKCFAAIFSFPCTTILLTNSAVSLRVLGTLNGVATSISALGRAAGPAITGWMFSIGANKGYIILPWWTLAAFATLGAIAPWWLVEMEGFGGGEASDEENEEAADEYDDTLRGDQTGVGENLPADCSGGRTLAESRRGHDHITTNNSHSVNSQQLLNATDHTIEEDTITPLKRISSPIGLKENVGPGGSDKLSNGLGQTRSGLGAGGTSFH